MTLAELEKIGRQRAATLERLATINHTARAAANQAHADGIAETQIAVALRVDRLTIRRWLGK